MFVGMFRNGGGLGTGESYIPVVLFDSPMHKSPCFPDVDFTAFTGSSVNHAILFSWIDGVLSFLSTPPSFWTVVGSFVVRSPLGNPMNLVRLFSTSSLFSVTSK